MAATRFFPDGFTLPDGSLLNLLFGNLLGTNPNAAATPGGGQTNAAQVSSGMTEVSVTATAADSIKLPQAVPGAAACLRNSGVASMQVFGQAGETINAVASATGVAQANGTTALYLCFSPGKWFRLLSA